MSFQLNPQLLKAGTTTALISLLEPLQASFQASKEWQETEKLAYPPPPSTKKVKKQKVLGTKYQKAKTDVAEKEVETQPDGSVEGKQAAEVSLGKNVDDAMEKLDVKDGGVV
jgi:tyrosyl-tRNA synthetase